MASEMGFVPLQVSPGYNPPPAMTLFGAVLLGPHHVRGATVPMLGALGAVHLCAWTMHTPLAMADPWGEPEDVHPGVRGRLSSDSESPLSIVSPLRLRRG